MLEYYRKSETGVGIQKIDHYEKDTWINMVAPTPEEIEEFTKKFDLPPDFFTDPTDPDEIPRLEFDDEDFIMVIRVPYETEDGVDMPFNTLPLGIIILFNKNIITVCQKKTELLDMFTANQVKLFNPSLRDKSILQFFNRSVQLYIKYIKRIRQITDDTEDSLKETVNNNQLAKLLNIEKSLIQFRASLRSNYRMIQKLQKSALFKLSETESDLLEDVLIDIKQAIEMADIYSKIMKEMMEYFSSLMSNNLNNVMRFLAGLTIIIAIPTLISSIYGMNVDLPFQDSPHAFYITVGISSFLTVVGLVTLIYKKYM